MFSILRVGLSSELWVVDPFGFPYRRTVIQPCLDSAAKKAQRKEWSYSGLSTGSYGPLVCLIFLLWFFASIQEAGVG